MSIKKSLMKLILLSSCASILVACGDDTSSEGVVTLAVKCQNNKGWSVLIKHIDDKAVLIKPVANPAEGYNPVARNVEFKERDIGYWYDAKQLTKKFNVKLGPYFKGYTQANYDKRDATFTISTSRGASGGIYRCSPATDQDFALYE